MRKNPLIVVGILLYIFGIFLPWGPVGTQYETGFSEEGSPGLLAILPAILAMIIAYRTSRKQLYFSFFLGILLSLVPIAEIMEIAGNDAYGFSSINYGLYVMIFAVVVQIYGAYKGLKKPTVTENN